MPSVVEANSEAIEAWNGPLFDRFVRFRHIVTDGLGAHGEQALAYLAPRPGDRAVDIGCGFGDTTGRLAELVGPQGTALGVDAAPRFIDAARTEQDRPNLRFAVADVEAAPLGERFDLAFSRFGTMFFANPVAALRNVCASLGPGGRLCMVVWRRKRDNAWLHRAEEVVAGFLARPAHSDEPTCGPGPFSMADADTTSDILLAAGFGDVALHRCDLAIRIGDDLEQAVEFAMALGPAGEVLRLAGADADRIRPRVAAALRDGLAELAGPQGVLAGSSTWIVTARAPA